jgi:tetratricopeptide (TPR) repeat protein
LDGVITALPEDAMHDAARTYFRPAHLRWTHVVLLWSASVVACASAAPRPSANRTEVFIEPHGVEREPVLPENVATAILLGSALLEAGDVRGALAHYEFAFATSPDDLELGRRYVEVALRAGRGREALVALDHILVVHPDQLDLQLQRIRILSALGEAELARDEADALAALHPDDIELLDLQSDLHMGARAWQAALDVVDRMLQMRPEESALWSRRATLLDALERDDESETAWRRTLELDPTDAHAADRITELLRAQGRTEELVAILEAVVQKGGAGPLVQARLADLYLAKGDFARTVELLGPLAERGALEPRARVILADLLAGLDREEEAIAVLRDLVGEGIEGPVLRMLGELQLEAGRLDEAEANLRAAVEANPTDTDALVTLLVTIGQAEPRLFRGEGDAARRADFSALLERATGQVDSGSLRQNFLVGALLRRSGDLERAGRLLQRAAELDPDNRQVLYDLAIVQEGTKAYREAATTLQRLLALDPDDAHLMNFYGYLLADQGWELEKAERLIRAAVEAEPDNGAYVDSLGWVLYRQGDLEGALEQLIRAANLVGDDPVVLEHLGDCLRDLGQREEAVRTYRRALAAGGDRERLEARIRALGEDERGSP